MFIETVKVYYSLLWASKWGFPMIQNSFWIV